MAVISKKQLLEAGVHFGHNTRRWNPKMKEYIYEERNGIYIIDLTKTEKLVEEAYQEELEKGTISATDIVKLTGGSGAINETVNRRFNYIFDAWKEVVKGTEHFK